MATQNRISKSIWVRRFVALVVIGLLLPIGSVSAQTQGPGGFEKQRPAVDASTQNPAEGTSADPADVANVLQDPSFEASFGSQAYWSQASTNFGTPVCPSTTPAPAGCGNGGGTAGPRSGSAWVWFGGTVDPEVGSVSQTVAFPTSCNVTLQFYLWIGTAQSGSNSADYFAVSVDSGSPIFQANASQKRSYSSYKLVSLSLKAYADGNPHTIHLTSSTSGQIVNFNVDDVTLAITNCTCGAIVQGAAAQSVPNNYFIDQLVAGESVTAGPLSIANGSDTTGVFRPTNGALYLKNKNETGFADVQINYGLPGDCPVTGDWDGNGTDTIGIYRNGSFYLRNANTIGFADLVFAFGAPGDQPVAGDWNGDGVDTIGIYRSGTFFLRNSNTAGVPEMSFSLGVPGDVGIAGDWNNDGIGTTGVFRPSNGALYLKNTNITGFADIQINYGLPGDRPVTGDWDNNGTDTIGIYRNGAFYLRNANTIGYADMVFALGVNGDLPISGNWDALP